MTFLTKPNELKSPTTIKGLILGDTNNGKTTLALSAPEPILIDFDSFLMQSINMTLAFGTFGHFPLCKYKANKNDNCCQNASDDYEMLVITLLDVAMLNKEGPHNTYKNRRQLLVVEPTDSKLVRDLKSLLQKLQIREHKIESHSIFSSMLTDILYPYVKNKLEYQPTIMNDVHVLEKSNKLPIQNVIKKSKKSKKSKKYKKLIKGPMHLTKKRL